MFTFYSHNPTFTITFSVLLFGGTRYMSNYLLKVLLNAALGGTCGFRSIHQGWRIFFRSDDAR